jgi:inward rectifier potassium channel
MKRETASAKSRRPRVKLARKFKAALAPKPRGPWVKTGLKKNLLDELYPYLLDSSWFGLIGFIAVDFVVVNAAFAFGYRLLGGVSGVREGSLTDLFFFSVQTMATIGYGQMAPVSVGANVLVSAEALLGLIGLALVTGLIFAKFSRPTARVRFSQCALVGLHNGVPCLMFRMANERASQIVEATIHVVMIRREVTLEGQMVWRNYDLEMVRHRNPFFTLSWLALHQIAPRSPLYGLDAQTLDQSVAMITVSLVGIDDSYAQTVQARHDYRLADIVWGARFVDMLHSQPDGAVVADFSRIDEYEQDSSLLPALAGAMGAAPDASGGRETPAPAHSRANPSEEPAT